MPRLFLTAALFAAAPAFAGNPIVPDVGLTDPHISIFGDRAYVYASHDASPKSSYYIMNDWWAWSSSDLVEWKLECVLKPEDTYLKRPLKECWATFCVTKNNKYYWYFSAGPTNIGVVVGDTPSGPWKDPIGKPLVSDKVTPIAERDPDILMDDDGKAYMVFGHVDYYLVRLADDMVSLAEKPRLLSVDFKINENGKGSLSDKPSLHKRNGVYYLSWAGFYAMSDNPYGPYKYKGTVVVPEKIAPEFECSAARKKNSYPSKAAYPQNYDRHGNFFTWHNQWFYTCNDRSGPNANGYFRNAIITYVHYRDNGEIAPVRIDAIGVGQYDAAQARIEAEDFFASEKAEVREIPGDNFEMRGLRDGSTLTYPRVKNLPQDATLALRLSSATGGGTLEVREGSATGKLLGSLAIPATGGWDKYQTLPCPLKNAAGQTGLCFVFKGKDECARLDWWKVGAPDETSR